MTTNRTEITRSSPFNSAALWLNRGIEALWLLTVVLVPIAFLDRDYVYSEAVIAYFEVPKIALIRTLVGLMTVLWLIEWGLREGRFLPINGWGKGETGIASLAFVGRLRGWLSGQPTRWVILAVWFFAITTTLSTIFSASFRVSLWGEVPGQDGLSTYTLAAHLLLFAVITSHLKTRPQLWRLLGAVVAMGVVVAGIAILQHYGHDVLGALEATGGGQARVTSTVGNAVFAGALMLIPTAVSLMLATMMLEASSSENAGAVDQRKGRRRSPKSLLLIICSWTLVLTIQFLGLSFTFSRGPWLGTILALMSFLFLTILIVGWRAFAWASLILGLAALITWAVLNSYGTGLTPDIGGWLIAPLILAGILTAAATFQDSLPLVSATQKKLAAVGRLGLSGNVKSRLVGVMVLGSGVAVVLGLTILLTWSFSRSSSPAVADETKSSDLTPFDVTERFASLSGEVLSGGLSNRVNLWNGSLTLMRDRPWFEFDDLTLRWLRPLVGYGPDLFRYTYLLVSVPLDASLLPAEPDHAHNFILNQGVEQGILGLVSALGIFLATFGAAGYLLIKRSENYSQFYKLVLIGLVAAIIGRFLEQLVGLTRVSDLMLFWVILAAFAALPVIMGPDNKSQPEPGQGPSPIGTPTGRASRSPHQRISIDLQTFLRLALVAWAVGGIMALTWVKAVNYPRAAIAGSKGIAQFNRGDYQASLASLDRATQLAPDVPIYYVGKASIYTAFLQNSQVPREAECSLEPSGINYQECLVRNIHLNNIRASEQRPFDWRARTSRADSALALGLDDEAIQLYQEVINLVPTAWPLYNRLAEVYIEIGQPELALTVLEDSMAITGESYLSNQAISLQNLALEDLAPTRDPSSGRAED